MLNNASAITERSLILRTMLVADIVDIVQGQPLKGRQVVLRVRALHLVVSLIWPGNSALRCRICAKRNMRQGSMSVSLRKIEEAWKLLIIIMNMRV